MDKEEYKLPLVNGLGYYEIRLESIGGLGANLSGKLLGELGAEYMGLNSASFSSYGSEKRGSPVKAFIRWAEKGKDIRINSPVTQPHILGVFHENLAGKQQLIAGVDEKTKIVVNTANSPDQIRDRFKRPAGHVYCIDALKIAQETKSRINMVLLGAIVKASGFIPLELMEKLIQNTLGEKYPKVLPNNLKAVKRGFEETKEKRFDADGKYQYVSFQEIKSN